MPVVLAEHVACDAVTPTSRSLVGRRESADALPECEEYVREQIGGIFAVVHTTLKIPKEVVNILFDHDL